MHILVVEYKLIYINKTHNKLEAFNVPFSHTHFQSTPHS